jgi:hypothetical protein
MLGGPLAVNAYHDFPPGTEIRRREVIILFNI